MNLRRSGTKFVPVLAAVLLTTALAGCIVEQPRGEVIVRQAPPPPRYEVIPPPPREFVEWRPGHWRWDGREYAWIPGEYVERPRREARWEPGHWAERPNGWVWVEGHWR
jgi:hypothetical protein